jgi:outer membrane protein assembly factor BamD (BamD/ComL family)
MDKYHNMLAINQIKNDSTCQKRLYEMFQEAIKNDNLSVADSLLSMLDNKQTARKILKCKMKELVASIFESMDVEEAFERLSLNREIDHNVVRFKILRDINKTI